LLVAGKVQRAEAIDERAETIESPLVDAVLAAVDGGEHFAGEVRGFAPFDHGGLAQRAVAGDKIECSVAEFVEEFVELVGQLTEARVQNETPDATQEREAGAFDRGLHPGLDQGEGLQRVARDEAVGDVCRIEPEVFRI
jgi:hypothetical protein